MTQWFKKWAEALGVRDERKWTAATFLQYVCGEALSLLHAMHCGSEHPHPESGEEEEEKEEEDWYGMAEPWLYNLRGGAARARR